MNPYRESIILHLKNQFNYIYVTLAPENFSLHVRFRTDFEHLSVVLLMLFSPPRSRQGCQPFEAAFWKTEALRIG
jgi:hypothetical protein